MTRLVFVVPCHGRHALAAACLRQLRRTCDDLADGGLDAAVVLVSDEDVFRGLARELRFDHVPSPNQPLGHKWNNGFEWACVGLGADVVAPFGSDDAIDAGFVLAGGMPSQTEIRCARRSAVVSPDGSRMSLLNITYERGDGVRFYPRQLLEPSGFRPCREDRRRAIDTNTMAGAADVVYFDSHPVQIVDFKTAGGNLNSYDACHQAFGVAESRQPFVDLAGVYPDVFLDDVQALYGLVAA